eukprot:4047698-Prymnesium_polylepis.2
MAIMQQRHVRQIRSTSTNNNSYYFNVIIYLSIYELGARHRCPQKMQNGAAPKIALETREAHIFKLEIAFY